MLKLYFRVKVRNILHISEKNVYAACILLAYEGTYTCSMTGDTINSNCCYY